LTAMLPIAATLPPDGSILTATREKCALAKIS
jgi:hypothetical protein